MNKILLILTLSLFATTVSAYLSPTKSVLSVNGQTGNVVIPTGTGDIDSVNGLTNPDLFIVAGSSGSDFNIQSAIDTITLNFPTSSASNRGLLSSTDWSTFNSKQAQITSTTTADYYRGDKTFQPLNKAAVGLGSVDNTSDLAKPISTATQTALDSKQAVGNYVTALTGDVTASGPGSVAATIANLAVTNAKIANSTIDLTAKVTGTLPIANGGTNSNTALSGSSIMLSNGSAIVQGSAGTSTTLLHGNASGAPTYAAASLTADVSGVLPKANGGTNSSAALSNNRVMISSSGAIVEHSALTAGSLLFADSNGLPGQDNASLFWNNSSKFLGLLTAAPTHTVTHGSTSTGTAFYNTSDQTTNYERATMGWSGNIFNIDSGKAGSGTSRAMRLTTITGTSGIELSSTSAGTVNVIGSSPRIVANSSNVGMALWGKITAGTSAAIELANISNFTASSGTQILAGLTGTMTQTSTAGYKGLQVNVTETTTGSGQKDLLSLEVGGTPRARIDNLGNLYQSSAATSGHTIYNTADEVTNYERGRLYYNSNVLTLIHDAGGSGSINRDLKIQSRNTSITIAGATNDGVINIAGTASGYTQILQTTANSGISLNGAITTSTTTAALRSTAGGTPFSASSGVQTGAFFDYTLNQSSTAGYKALKVSATETSTGSGQKDLLSLEVGGTTRFRVDNLGNNVISSAATNGFRIYNTADETTNTEYGMMKWTANVLTLDTLKSGTGVGRNLQLIADSGASILIGGGGGSRNITATSQIGSGAVPLFTISNASSWSATSGIQDGLIISGTVNQASGTGGWRGLIVNPTLTAVGSAGAKLADFQAGSSTKLSIDSGGKITMDNTVTAAGTTGDRTINKPSGTVNFAAAATAITVTNSLVTANSLVHSMARTNDTTCSVKNVVPTAGSFTINMSAACTAETSVSFVVFN